MKREENVLSTFANVFWSRGRFHRVWYGVGMRANQWCSPFGVATAHEVGGGVCLGECFGKSVKLENRKPKILVQVFAERFYVPHMTL